MRNFTLRKFNSIKLLAFILFLMISYNASAQFYTKHYIAPAPWQYFSKANEIVIATNSTATVNITVSKSDGTVVTTLIASKGAPAIYRFSGKPSAAPAFAFNTVLNAAGLIVTGSAPISINLRNVASDALGGDGSDQDIKGNAALTSFGDAGIGIRFRVGYYRDGSLGNFNNYGDQRPIYSVMAITNGTTVTIGGVITATLNAGQSYLFKATIGTLVETSNPSVMNTSAFIDTPNGCGDGAFNQIPPEAVLGSEYFIERGKGNDTAEQTTVIATKPNTKVIVDTYSVTGALVSTKTTTLATAGSFFTFLNGVSGANFSASRVSADNNVVVYSGTAQSCEVDISTIAPVSECGGSKFIETAKFRNYGTGSLPYFGYVLLKDAVSKVYVNGVDIETKSGVSARHQLGATGWYLINFEDTQIGSPDVLSISSDAKLTVSIVQQGGGFSMAGFFSNFAVQPEDPTLAYIAGGGCTNSTAILSTPTGFVPYQWYFNGTAISGATSNTYTATKTGSYSVASTLTCGAQTQSKPVSVTLCTDLGVTKTVDNATPCVGSNVEFTVTLSNLGVNNATGVSVNDLLPTGYTFVSSTPSVGTYNSGTGVWSIGDINGGIAVTLKIVAKVNASGAYTNTAIIPASVPDTNSANNSASISTTPNPLPTASINGTLTACYTTTLTAVTNAGSPAYVWYKDNVVISGQISSTLVVTVDGDYKVKVTNTATTCENTSAVSTVKVSDTQKPTITCPSNVTAVADVNSCAATGVVLGTPTTTDNCTGTITVTNNAPSSFPIGITTVTWTAKDVSGNTQTCTQTVTVSDAQKPTITCLSNVTAVADANSCTATGVVLGTPTTTDNCTGTITVTNNAPSSFPIGVTTVTWTAKDASGNTQTCTQTVTVVGPIKANDDIISSFNGFSGGVAVSNVLSNDLLNCNAVITSDVNLTLASTLPSVLTFNTTTGSVTVNPQTPAGTYSFDYTICEKSNTTNCSTASVKITVVAPVIDAVTETTTSINGNTGGTTTESVITNDTLNGLPAVIGTNPGEVKLTGITVPTGLTLNANGTVTVAANTAAGNYNVEYSICEITNPTNCDSVISVVVVGKPTIDAVTETTASISGNTGGTTALLTANDTLNGNPVVIGTNPGEVKLTGITVPTGLTLNTDGTVTVAVNTAAGNYNVEYSICEITNPTNCDTVISVVVIGKPTIDAVTETTASINGNMGGTTTESVITNDTLNGNPVVIGTNPGEVKLTGITVPTGLTLNVNGTVTVAANTAAGNYNVEYSICEITNPTNCDSVISVVVVGKPTIDAVTETMASINGNAGGTTAESVITNDTLNGNPIVIGTNPGEVKLTGITVPTGLTLNSDGTVTVAANTPENDYEIEYSICEITNPTNCDVVKSIVTVTGGVLIANPDAVASVVATNQPQTVVNVFDNDTNNGIAVVPNDLNLTIVTADPIGFLTLNPDGTATLGANAPSGTYEIVYQICEKLNPSNCSSASVKVTVGTPVINAVEETTTAVVNGVVGGTTESLIANDTLNGNPVVIGTNPGEIKLSGVTLPTGFVLNADGTVTVPTNTPAGNYNVEYKICEINNPTNCDSATSIIVVTGGVLIANPDAGALVVATNQPQTVLNVFDNDTNNGIAIVPNDLNLTIVTADPTGFLTLNPDGTVTLGAYAPSGTYEIVYQICEKLNPSNCSSASVKVTVGTPVINAVEETVSSVNGTTGGTTTFSLVANDTLNGSPVVIGTNPGEVKLSAVTLPTGFVLNADGTVTVPANTPAGNYNVEYKICEINNPTNCDSATSIIVVTGGVLIANPDEVASVAATNQPQTVINVFDNDTNNGIAVVPNDLNLTIVTADPTGFLTLNPDGTVTLGANAPSGIYEIVYQICEKLNPANCSSASVKVTVGTPVINAVEETTTAVVNGVLGGTTESVIANDTLNGNPVIIGTNPGEVKLSAVTLPTGFVLNANGTVTVPTNTPAGNYNVEYKICEINNPTNCDSATSIIVVTGDGLQANPDVIPSVVESKLPQVLVNVFENDTNNGIAVVPNDLNLTIVTADPTGFLTVGADGIVNLGANAPSGTYELTYQICEKLDPKNCSQAVVRVKVNAVMPVTPATSIVANNDGQVFVDGINGQLAFINILDNDLLNGLPVNESDVVISNTPNPYFEFNSDGTVNVLPNTPGGSYTLTYQICEKANSTNCTTAILSVFVEVPAIAIIKTAIFNDENKDGYANAGETITYKFKITNTGNVPLMKIIVSDLLPGIILSGDAIDLGVNESDENNFTALYKINQSDVNGGSVSNQAIVQGKSAAGVVVEDKSDDSNNMEDKPTVLPLNGCQITVLNGFSPNGDGKNERFYIQGLECYPDNTVEIYNRWGVLVFDVDHYNNEDRAFVGYSAGRTTMKQSEGLPVGTYFYILKYRDSESNQHEKSGYLYINK